MYCQAIDKCQESNERYFFQYPLNCFLEALEVLKNIEKYSNNIRPLPVIKGLYLFHGNATANNGAT
jgi:hypothetical protein